MTFSVAAIVLFALGLIVFWPGRNAAPGVAAVVAQAPDAAQQPAPAVDKEPPSGNKAAGEISPTS